MKKIKKFFFIFFIYLSLLNTVNADIKIVYIDIDNILSSSEIGKSLFLKLKKNENLKFNELKLQEEDLKNQENKILASKNLISEDQLKSDIDEFKKKLNEYKEFKKLEIEKLQNNRNEEVTNLLKSINSVIEKYMSENSISMIVDKKNIYIADKNYDITNNIIELINKTFK